MDKSGSLNSSRLQPRNNLYPPKLPRAVWLVKSYGVATPLSLATSVAPPPFSSNHNLSTNAINLGFTRRTAFGATQCDALRGLAKVSAVSEVLFCRTRMLVSADVKAAASLLVSTESEVRRANRDASSQHPRLRICPAQPEDTAAPPLAALRTVTTLLCLCFMHARGRAFTEGPQGHHTCD